MLGGYASSEVEPKGRTPGVVRGAVGAADGAVGTAGYGAGIKHKDLIEGIQPDRGFGQEGLFIIGARDESDEYPACVTEETHSQGGDMHITISGRRIETEISYGTV